jgi:tartrate-resistant acid phosphatase type 5
MRKSILILFRRSVILVGIATGMIIALWYWNAGQHVYQVDAPITGSPNDCQADLRFAVIGDYGDDGLAEADVARMVRSWDVDLIVTTGDNNYPDGEASSIDANIGQYYAGYIYPYKGDYGPGGDQNRFFPSLGNHDWREESLQPYTDFFTLPGNERYYDFESGAVHFFILDSDEHEPDGITAGSTQADWFQQAIAASEAPWKLVFMHHPPYGSSSMHGSANDLQWPFAAWGSDAVFAGHAHLYERILHDGIPYFVNGLGGRWRTIQPIHSFGDAVEGSQVRYNRDYGAQLVTADDGCINFSFYARSGAMIDSYTLLK